MHARKWAIALLTAWVFALLTYGKYRDCQEVDLHVGDIKDIYFSEAHAVHYASKEVNTAFAMVLGLINALVVSALAANWSEHFFPTFAAMLPTLAAVSALGWWFFEWTTIRVIYGDATIDGRRSAAGALGKVHRIAQDVEQRKERQH